MRSSALRFAHQQLLLGSRRFASTNSPAGNTATNVAKDAAATASASAAKAKEQAVLFAGKAVEVLGKSGQSFAKVAARTGGRTGRILRTVECEFIRVMTGLNLVLRGSMGGEASRWFQLKRFFAFPMTAFLCCGCQIPPKSRRWYLLPTLSVPLHLLSREHWTHSDDGAFSLNPQSNLLWKSRLRTFKACFPRPEHDTTVC